MGEVITDYADFFQAIRAFNQRPVEDRKKICGSYFLAISVTLPSFKARQRLDAYAAKAQSQYPSRQTG